jgi:hypothetical protein
MKVLIFEGHLRSLAASCLGTTREAGNQPPRPHVSSPRKKQDDIACSFFCQLVIYSSHSDSYAAHRCTTPLLLFLTFYNVLLCAFRCSLVPEQQATLNP